MTKNRTSTALTALAVVLLLAVSFAAPQIAERATAPSVHQLAGDTWTDVG